MSTKRTLLTCNCGAGSKCCDTIPLLIVVGVIDRSGFGNEVSRLDFASSERGEAAGGGILGGIYGLE